MNRLILAPLMLLSLVVSSSMAQSSAVDKAATFGLGFSVQQRLVGESDPVYYGFDYSNVLVPITWGSKLRTEFELGFWRYARSWEQSGQGMSNGRLSVGIYFLQPRLNEKMIFYFGPRIGLNRFTHWHESEYSSPNRQSQSRTDWNFDAAFGGEYYLSRHFSLGGEARLLYYRFGKFADDEDEKESLITSKAMVIFRFYF